MARAKKAAPAAEENDTIKPEQLPGKAATLTLRDGTDNAVLYGRVVIDGNPDGLVMFGNGHRVKAMTPETVILERACDNVNTAKQLYLERGWTE